MVQKKIHYLPQRFSDRRHPNSAAFANMKQNFDRNCYVKYKKKEHIKSARYEEHHFPIAAVVVQGTYLSSREMSRQL